MKDFPEKILNTINREHIRPKPRWEFLLKDKYAWVMCVLMIVFAGAAFCTAVYVFLDIDKDIYFYLGRGQAIHFLASVPYFWLVMGLLSVWVSKVFFNRTRFGYRTGGAAHWFLSVFIAVLVVVAMYGLNWQGVLVERFFARSEFLNRMIYNNSQIWQHPEDGLLGGIIIEKNEDEFGFVITDKNGEDWQIMLSNNIELEQVSSLVPGERVKLIGTILSPLVFEADEIRIWK